MQISVLKYWNYNYTSICNCTERIWMGLQKSAVAIVYTNIISWFHTNSKLMNDYLNSQYTKFCALINLSTVLHVCMCIHICIFHTLSVIIISKYMYINHTCVYTYVYSTH